MREKITNPAAHGVNCDSNRIPEKKCSLADTLGSCRDHILLLQFVEKAATHHPDHPGGSGCPDDDDGNGKVFEQIDNFSKTSGSPLVLELTPPPHTLSPAKILEQ